MKWFVDGKDVTNSLSPTWPTTQGKLPINMGHYRVFNLGSSAGGASPFNGAIEDFKIYNIAFTDTQAIKRIYGTVDMNQPFSPFPADKSINVPQATTVLSWYPGDNAKAVNGHRVYFGTDWAAVGSATSGYTTTTDPNVTLTALGTTITFGTNYYWRVDEVSASGHVTKGTVWCFRTEFPTYLVENFESYSPLDKAISGYWLKTGGGAGITLCWSGSTVTSPYNLKDPNYVGEGGQSMQVRFNNNTSPYKCEYYADVNTLPFASRNFAKAGVKALELLIRGDVSNVANKVYFKLTDMSSHSGQVACPDPNVLKRGNGEWYTWRIQLSDPNFSTVVKSSIQNMTIGIGKGTNAGQTDTYDYAYIDGIYLYGSRCLGGAYDSAADMTGYDGRRDCKVDILDLRLFAEQWLSASAVDNGPAADFDDVNGVNMVDYSTLANDWLKVYPLWP